MDTLDDIYEGWTNQVGTIDKPDEIQYAAYQRETQEVLDILKVRVPELLKKEPFFAKVFYPSLQH